jgi:beta-glucosidase
MQYSFPPDFIFGTSTAAAQIETASMHDWEGFTSKDGQVFNRTTDHELRFKEDAELIASLAPGYRMSLMWSKLQREPFGELNEETAQGYLEFLTDLKKRGVHIMMVLHHFTNPIWFAERSGWEKEQNINLWIDFVEKVVHRFGPFITQWNTFNEPNVYVSNGWLTGFFPPFKRNPLKAIRAVKNMGKAHQKAYQIIKSIHPDHLIGISHNAVIFYAQNFLGHLPAIISDWWFMDWVPKHFEQVDFFGMSYYARVGHDPMPISFIDTPEKIKKLGLAHDDIWEYHPEGLRTCIERYWKKYKKPIIITENGVCDASDTLRQKAILDYAHILRQCLEDGIDIRGYYWWSTWDNFEWHLGPSKRFGLYECDLETKERRKRKSADVYSRLAHSKTL